MHVDGNVADVILAQLSEWGVQRIYGVLGDAVFPLFDALGRQDRIKFVAAVHETNAAFMATYDARMTGELAVCTASAGPGAVSLLNGLADAFMDGVPVLAITGQVDTKDMGFYTKQYFDQQAVFSFFSKNTSLLADPHAVVKVLTRAVRAACLESSVAHVSVPGDVFKKTVSVETVPANLVKIRSTPVFSGNQESIYAAVRNAQRPVIVAGKGSRAVKDQVLELAYKTGAGIVEAHGLKGIIGGRHELYLGGIGEAYLPPIVREADCLIIVGDVSHEMKFIPESSKIVYLGEHPGNIPVNAAAAATGDLGLLTEALLYRLGRQVLNREWFERVKGESHSGRQALPPLTENAVPLHPLKVMASLGGTVPQDAIIALDIGEFAHWFDRGFLGDRQEVLISGKWRSTGCGLPAAIGAKLACPDWTVVAIVGDGGFLASMSELLTCVRHNLDITTVVIKNGIYSLEKNKMSAEGLNPFGYELHNPDFVQFAKSCGAEGFRIEDPADIEKTVRFALQLGKPVLLEIICAAVSLPNAGISG
ncbi:MAG TPA: thiamine pyrophosphate-binding protein [Bacillota bacterium]|nr:thiamine pyrophosphate-binding protein [Bacillota bacterium]